MRKKATTEQVFKDLQDMGNEIIRYIGSETRDYSGRKITLEHYATSREFTEEEEAALKKKYSNVSIASRPVAYTPDGRGVIHILDKKCTTLCKYILEEETNE